MSKPQQRRSSIQRRIRSTKGIRTPSDPTTSHSFAIPTTHLPNAPMATTSSSTSLPDFGAAPSDAYTISLWDEQEEAPLSEKYPKRRSKKKTSRVADPCMAEWVSAYRESFLSALLWLDGRGRYTNEVCTCKDATQSAVYRCCNCMHGPLLCKDCIITSHKLNPFHWIEEWTGTYFKRRSLKSLGVHLQLGHIPGERCLVPHPGHQDFVVIHGNGVHDVAVDFCGCDLHERVDHATQLLRARLYPSSGPRPRTCATFACLDKFHALSLHGKTSTYDYYHALEYRTNASRAKPLDRYKVFLRMSRQYRHLLLLKRRGRGHTSAAIADTRPGELAIRCAACPRPDVNLPPDWQDAAAADQCLYVIFIALDACFRLKRRLVGSDLRDPGLGTGWAYFVEWEPYREYLLTVTDQKEISTCTGLAALDHANTKFARRIQRNRSRRRDLYANMDYILGSLLRHVHHSLRKIFSYDIACQWGKYLKDRLLALPPLV
ncbi:CxC2 domain-containing protein [Mycena kentingensis (nom. inval.)]|nr:CxC2 domain-containing protein [Mycena kentingensis (nom. inval.)]